MTYFSPHLHVLQTNISPQIIQALTNEQPFLSASHSIFICLILTFIFILHFSPLKNGSGFFGPQQIFVVYYLTFLLCDYHILNQISKVQILEITALWCYLK